MKEGGFDDVADVGFKGEGGVDNYAKVADLGGGGDNGAIDVKVNKTQGRLKHYQGIYKKGIL